MEKSNVFSTRFLVMAVTLIVCLITSNFFVPRLWQIWEDPIYGKMRCIRVEKSGKSRATITVELLPRAWKIR